MGKALPHSMEGQETPIAEQPAEIYSIDEGKYVPNPLLKQETQKEETDPADSEDPADPADPEETDDATDPKEEIDPADPDPVDPADDPDPADPADPEPKDEVLDPDAYFAEVFGTKYGVKTQAEVETLIENALALQDEHEALTAKMKENEAGKPKFSSEKEEKAFNFLKQFDINRQGEALDTYAKLIAMDVDQSDEMMVLEERYIHEHPEWSRTEAQRMFQKEHNRKYNLKKENFESEEEYKSEVEDAAIMKKGEVARARTFLKEKQTTYKPKPVEEKPLVSEAVTKSIEKTAPEYTEFADKTSEITFEQGADKYTFKLDADKKAKVNEAVKAWVKNPANYNQDGKLLGVKDPKQMLSIVAGGMFMNDIISAVADQVKNSVNIKRVEEVGKTQPKKRKAIGSGEVNQSDDLYAQAAKLMKKKAAAN